MIKRQKEHRSRVNATRPDLAGSNPDLSPPELRMRAESGDYDNRVEETILNAGSIAAADSGSADAQRAIADAIGLILRRGRI
jgi:hypothetical protein